MIRLRSILLIGAAAAVLALGATGCGDDSDDEQTTLTAQTETRSSTDPSGSAALHDCPDASVAGDAVTEIRTNLACAEATGIAHDVLTRDDCIEETPGGTNTCRVDEFDCEVDSAAPVPAAALDVSCDAAGERHIEFTEQRTSAEGV